jgi:ornithine cyclodeaminase/alanine dehydrogenase-like protein (mu-crystallin family)
LGRRYLVANEKQTRQNKRKQVFPRFHARQQILRIFSPSQTAAALKYPALIQSICAVFASGATAPQRHHHTIKKTGEPDCVLLLMPAWAEGFGVGGVKIVNVVPGNSGRALPAIMASYLVFDEITGEHKAMLDGATLTAKRTAAVAALAADRLARQNSKTLLIVGSGRVAQELPHAFKAVRDIETVLVWSRTPASADALAKTLNGQGFSASSVTDIQSAVVQADIISCATLASEPVIKGAWLRPGQHLDLIGSYAPHMREADDEAMSRALVFIDTEAALHETGDLIKPIESGALSKSSIKGTLYDLCRADFSVNRTETDITLFKGVGHALEDLAAAKLALASIG